MKYFTRTYKNQGIVTLPASYYATPRLVAPLMGSLSCNKPVGLSMLTEGVENVDYRLDANGVLVRGKDDSPACTTLPYIYQRADNIAGLDISAGWWAAWELQMDWACVDRRFYNDDPAKHQYTCDWFNIATPNADRTGAVDNHGFILERGNINQSWNYNSLGYDGMTISVPVWGANHIGRFVLGWHPTIGLYIWYKWSTDGVVGYSVNASSAAKTVPSMSNPVISLSGAMFVDHLAEPYSSYQDGCHHRNFVLGNGTLDAAAVAQFLNSPQIFVAAVSAL